MPALKTEVTEIITGLATLGFKNIQEALSARPPEMLNVESPHWDRLTIAFGNGRLKREFDGAWSNGLAFLHAEYGLRDRRPRRIEWKGPHRPPGYDLIPADLRIDHVFLISCKYWSRVLFNPSPSHLFARLLATRHMSKRTDWYLNVAPVEYQSLYAGVRSEFPKLRLPQRLEALTGMHRSQLKRALAGGWPGDVEDSYREFSIAVARVSAAAWGSKLATTGRREEMLWRLLRLASAPYFVLGSSGRDTLRLRIKTPWDWRQEFELRSFDVWADDSAGQPVVRWHASVRSAIDDDETVVAGHVEIRWSHGRFQGNPEAKVYLDSPYHLVPGYVPL